MGNHLLNPQEDERNTKSRGHCWRLRLGGAGGADRRKTSFPSCRHRHPHRHAVHDASSNHGKKKPPLAVKKVRLAPVQKQLLVGKPLPGPPQGAGANSCCVLGSWVVLPPFGEGWGEASLPWVAAPTIFATL